MADQCGHCSLPERHSSRGWCIAALRAEIDRLKHASALSRQEKERARLQGRETAFFMDERDVMACAALTGLLHRLHVSDTNAIMRAAGDAYVAADALLAARKPKEPDHG